MESFHVAQNLFLILHGIEWLLVTIGICIIFVSALQATYVLLSSYCKGRFDPDQIFDTVRRLLGCGIILGLEFILAADVISTVLLPDYYHLGMLGLLVLIRTVLNFFLDKEIHQLRLERTTKRDVV